MMVEIGCSREVATVALSACVSFASFPRFPGVVDLFSRPSQLPHRFRRRSSTVRTAERVSTLPYPSIPSLHEFDAASGRPQSLRSLSGLFRLQHHLPPLLHPDRTRAEHRTLPSVLLYLPAPAHAECVRLFTSFSANHHHRPLHRRHCGLDRRYPRRRDRQRPLHRSRAWSPHGHLQRWSISGNRFGSGDFGLGRVGSWVAMGAVAPS